MDSYKISWNDTVHGTIEIHAKSYPEAISKFKTL